jgi:hypothetical protein
VDDIVLFAGPELFHMAQRRELPAQVVFLQAQVSAGLGNGHLAFFLHQVIELLLERAQSVPPREVLEALGRVHCPGVADFGGTQGVHIAIFAEHPALVFPGLGGIIGIAALGAILV